MLKRIQLKRECKKLAKTLCGDSPFIIFQQQAYYNPEKEMISLIVNEPEDITTITSRKFFKKLVEVDLSIFTYTILHELGHFYTFTLGLVTPDIMTSLEAGEIYSALIEENLLGIDKAFELYYNEPVEKLANDQMLLWIEKYKNEIIKFDERIKELQ